VPLAIFQVAAQSDDEIRAILFLCFIGAFFIALPYLNPHGWTMFPVLLSILGSFFSMLILVIGIERWRRHRKSVITTA
jgi:protein-S-isoprenylcysteine O-methyltransferase Ste14